jgi:exodeoxyribonuclease III
MKIISFNVNGIRSAVSKGFIEWLQATDCDILCLQEVKASPDQIDLRPFTEMGYTPYWFPAQKKGYSGVAIFSRIAPLAVTYGCGIDAYDCEGRQIRFDTPDFTLVNIYTPSGSSRFDRHLFKMQWMEDFYQYLDRLKTETDNIIVCGDFNICPQPIDIHNPKANANASGFMPEEREWVTKVLNNGFVDVFRAFNPEPHQYTWWSFRAGSRQKNLGWRIDYHLISQSLLSRVNRALILQEAKFSDHCPVYLELQ